jgi:DNA-directed RNA polymerase specialized sigma24 family protein
VTANLNEHSGDLPPGLAALAAAHGSDVGDLAALVIQHRAAAEEVTARCLVHAYRDPHLPSAGRARRIHVLRMSLRRILDAERRSGAVDPHALAASAELLAQSVSRVAGTPSGGPIPGRALLAAMASLPAPGRALVVLRHLLDLEPSEMATVAGGNPGRIQRQLQDAEERLRQRLEDPGTESGIEEIGDVV